MQFSGLAGAGAKPVPRAQGEAGGARAQHADWIVTAWTTSAHETKELGAALASVLLPGDVVLLAGDLGAGKTTLAKGLAAGLGVTETVTSPTFTLVRTYECAQPVSPGGARRVSALVHADLFRLDRLREVVDLAIDEPLEEGAVALVEWGDVAVPVLGRDSLTVSIEHGAALDHEQVRPSDKEEVATPAQRTFKFSASGGWADRRRMLADVLETWGGEAPEPAPE